MLSFIKRNKIILLLSLVILLGAFLRLYRFDDLTRFNTDQVRDAEVVDKMLSGEEFPLLGPKAGGTLFKLGPAFYYLEALSGFVFGATPAKMVLFVMLLAVASIPLLFYFLRYFFSASVSLFLVLIYSGSFYVIKYSRFGWNPNIIPFFFILFLLSLLKIIESKDEKIGFWHLWLAISLGIGVQLHTLLLVLMPALLLLAYAYIFFREKKLRFSRLFLIFLAALLLNAPFFLYDFQNDGKNLKNFLAGAEKKTAKNSSFIDNFLQDGQLFIQGNTYALSSFEPQKNWLKVRKLLATKNPAEISAAFFGTLFSLFGFFYLIKNFLAEKAERKKIFLGAVLASALLSFLILLPIANELNVRYFIILIFLPYIFLGFLVEFLLKHLPKLVAFFAIFFLGLFLGILNLKTYAATYNLENYTVRASLYGGISVKESRDLSDFMLALSKRSDFQEKKLFMSSFKFSPSIDYFNNKKDLILTDLSEYAQFPDSLLFTISDQKDIAKTLQGKEGAYNLIDSLTTGRFTIFAFEKK